MVVQVADTSSDVAHRVHHKAAVIHFFDPNQTLMTDGDNRCFYHDIIGTICFR